MDVFIIPNPLFPVVVCPYQSHDEFTGEPFKHSCLFPCWKCIIHKTSNKLSAVNIDQCHEQDKVAVKVSDEAVGLTEYPAALWRWHVARSEVAR